jgi:hypothetical protein
LGVRLTTSPCKKKFIENLLRKKILEEAKALWAAVPLKLLEEFNQSVLVILHYYHCMLSLSLLLLFLLLLLLLWLHDLLVFFIS